MELRTYWEIICRRKLILFQVIATIVGFALLVSLCLTPIYKVSAKTWIHFDYLQPVLITEQSNLLSIINPKSGFAEERNIIDTFIALFDVNQVVTNVVTDLHLKDSNSKSIANKDFVITFTGIPNLLLFQQRGVRINRVKAAEVLEISGYSPNREEAAKIANSVATAFSTFLAGLFRGRVTTARLAVEKQIDQMGKKLTEAEEAEAAFRVKEKLSDPKTQTITLIGERSALETRLRDAERSLAEYRSNLVAVQKVLQKQPGFHQKRITLENNPNIVNYKDQLLDLEIRLAGSLAELTVAHPAAKSLRHKIDEVKQALRKEISKTFGSEVKERNPYLDSLIERHGNAEINIIAQKAIINVVEKQISRKDQEISVIVDKEKILNILTADTAVYNNQYRVLKTKLENIVTMGTLDISNVIKVQSATVSKYPRKDLYFPKKLLILVISLLSSLPLGLLIIFLLDYMDDTIITPDEVQEKFNKPVLGIIPKTTEALLRTHFTQRGKSDRVFLDRFWDLCANIKLSIADKRWKIISITSTIQGEGKSTISSHLASTFAQAGQKVLLVDFNLRRPQLHIIFPLADIAPGVTNFLLGESVLEDIVQSTDIAGLDLIPGGSILPHPVKIINTPLLANLINEVKEYYDLIIFDTPAVEDGSDIKIIATHSDYLLLTVASGYVSEVRIKNAMETLNNSQIDVCGVVINKSEHG
jgi:polysaccharide biosynthesis transport protein